MVDLQEGDRLKIQRNAHLVKNKNRRKSKVTGVWEVTEIDEDPSYHHTPVATIQKVGTTGKLLKGETVTFERGTLESNASDYGKQTIEVKNPDYTPLGMRDFSIEIIKANNISHIPDEDIKNTLALGQVDRDERAGRDEKKNMRKALSNWFNGNRPWSVSDKSIYPEQMPMFFNWFNSEEYDKRNDEPDAIIKVVQR